MLKVTDDFYVQINGSVENLFVQYGTLTGELYRSFTKHGVADHSKVMLMLTAAQEVGIEAAMKKMKKEDEAENGGN